MCNNTSIMRMKRLLIILCVAMSSAWGVADTSVGTTSVDSYSWANICAGKVTPATWYGSEEAQQIADIVLEVQKNSGGWMKNDELHRLSASDYQRLIKEKGAHSCLDNYATTQEMRFLARVYAYTGEERFQQGFLRGLNLILNVQKGCGGWSQYWPLSGGGSYQDHITFNDDLMTNVMKMLRDIYMEQGDFEDICDAATLQRCRTAFDRGLDCILNCQIDDNGTLSAWCAQHDTIAPYYPMEGRPHELPSISGYESANLLSFLMTIDNPSPRLWNAITSAVTWLDQHKIPNCKIQDYTNAKGQPDRRIVTSQGNHLWGRFIQIGGASGQAVYQHFFQKLQTRGKSRSYTYNGIKYTYPEYQIAQSSYDPAQDYNPIYAIYKDTLQQMYYRFLYDYAPTTITTTVGASQDFLPDGCPVYTTLMATNRASYQYLGNWCTRVIYTEYPQWLHRNPQPTSLNAIDSPVPSGKKILTDGQVRILRAGQYYNLLGQLVTPN